MTTRTKPSSNMSYSNKRVKESINKRRSKAMQQPEFGILFDVDGVLARGTTPIPCALPAIQLLQDEAGEMRVPITFVTNALNKDEDKANQISSWLNIPISPNQMIQAQGPLKVYKQFHNKHCLLVGQGKVLEIAQDLGFTNFCTIDDIADAYPLLDVVDHDNRKRLDREGYVEKSFPRIEAVILMGEPKRWEQSLQLLLDILRTDGKPDQVPDTFPEEHIPVIACNMDLQFMERAQMPRFGHGAFLLCLEALYKKSTGNELKYTSLVGKPSEVTFRYAEHCLTKEARKLGINEPVKRMYLIGDTPDVDIVGANLYQRYIQQLLIRKNNDHLIDNNNNSTADVTSSSSSDTSSSTGEKSLEHIIDPDIPACRNTPPGTDFLPQTVTECHGVLVCTGVYRPEAEAGGRGGKESDGDEKTYHGHRDFAYNSALCKPYAEVADVQKAIEFILEKEKFVA